MHVLCQSPYHPESDDCRRASRLARGRAHASLEALNTAALRLIPLALLLKVYAIQILAFALDDTVLALWGGCTLGPRSVCGL